MRWTQVVADRLRWCCLPSAMFACRADVEVDRVCIAEHWTAVFRSIDVSCPKIWSRRGPAVSRFNLGVARARLARDGWRYVGPRRRTLQEWQEGKNNFGGGVLRYQVSAWNRHA